MRTYRTVLEQKIRERRQTLEEFAEYAETFAREHNQEGTLSLRHLQRLAAGTGPKGQPLGPVRPATARLLEHIIGLPMDQLLSPPTENTGQPKQRTAERVPGATAPPPPSSEHGTRTTFDWLDDHAGWIPDTTRRRVRSRLAKINTDELRDRDTKRATVTRSQIARALADYYGHDAPLYRARCGNHPITTSIITREDWLDLACPLTPETDQIRLLTGEPSIASDDIGTKHATDRLSEAVALDVCVTNAPLYRLLSVDPTPEAISGTVTRTPFVEYALTMDLLEGELIDSLTSGKAKRHPLRDTYLPDLDSVFDLSGRLCAGGTLALVAIARPADPYRGAPDYALLVQERSAHVLNAARRLSVIPKAFHQPLKDARADARIGATLRRELEEELFGRSEVDNTAAEQRVAEPMHPKRLSEPMRWLTDDPTRLRMECTGFGLNLVSGNYEFAGLVVIDDEEFWTRFGNEIEANWESSGLRLYSSLDPELISELVRDESWSNEGIFALSQGIRRLEEIGGHRVNLPEVEPTAVTMTPRASGR